MQPITAMDTAAALNVIASAADLAFVLDANGVIQDVRITND